MTTTSTATVIVNDDEIKSIQHRTAATRQIALLYGIMALALVGAFCYQNPAYVESMMQSSTSTVRKSLIRNEKKFEQSTWPECLGLTGEDCQAIIQVLDPLVQAQIVWPTDYSFPNFGQQEKVKIYVNDLGLVTSIPERGN